MKINNFAKKLKGKILLILKSEGNTNFTNAITQFRGALFFTDKTNKIEYALINSNGRYDIENFSLVEKIIRPGDVCFDIGANIGVYSMVFSRFSESDCNVHAFEPVNHIQKRFLQNRKLNKFKNLKLNRFALGSKSGEEEMYQIKENRFRGGVSSFHKNENIQAIGDNNFRKEKTAIKTLDWYVRENDIKSLDFIKIDVEGHELEVLKGAKESLVHFNPKILMEFDYERVKSIGEDPNEYKKFFSELGYSVYEFFVEGKNIYLHSFDFDRSSRNRNIFCIVDSEK